MPWQFVKGTNNTVKVTVDSYGSFDRMLIGFSRYTSSERSLPPAWQGITFGGTQVELMEALKTLMGMLESYIPMF